VGANIMVKAVILVMTVGIGSTPDADHLRCWRHFGSIREFVQHKGRQPALPTCEVRLVKSGYRRRRCCPLAADSAEPVAPCARELRVQRLTLWSLGNGGRRYLIRFIFSKTNRGSSTLVSLIIGEPYMPAYWR
jgi:hypothetical protein